MNRVGEGARLGMACGSVGLSHQLGITWKSSCSARLRVRHRQRLLGSSGVWNLQAARAVLSRGGRHRRAGSWLCRGGLWVSGSAPSPALSA